MWKKKSEDGNFQRAILGPSVLYFAVIWEDLANYYRRKTVFSSAANASLLGMSLVVQVSFELFTEGIVTEHVNSMCPSLSSCSCIFSSQVPLLALCSFPFLFQCSRQCSETDGWLDFNPTSQLTHSPHLALHSWAHTSNRVLGVCFLISSSPNQSFPI